MSQINVSNLTFCYEGSYDNIFENVSFVIDTDWKLGLIGRNGKGKTTFLQLLLGKYDYQGSIQAAEPFDYFPFEIAEAEKSLDTIQIIERIQPNYELWKVCRELDLLEMDAGLLYRPYETLSFGEQTRVMLALLFSGESEFLLIDEPTNHLDRATRDIVRDYLNSKKGFILVSHDRQLLDAVVDHVLVLEKNNIQAEQGNFSSWWENKQRRDAFELAENEKLKLEIRKLEASARKSAQWADKVERSKIGFDPIKEHDRFKDTRCYLGEKSRRMQQRRKNLQRRQQNAIEEKSGLLKNIDEAGELKLAFFQHHKEVYVRLSEFQVFYMNGSPLMKPLTFELRRGERLILSGRNGCGKSSVIKSILLSDNVEVLGGVPEAYRQGGLSHRGILETAAGLKISYINQSTGHLKGSLDDHIDMLGVSNSLFKSVLRRLDFDRVQFGKSMEEYSDGQKKKVLVAGSLLQQAHLYIWDEPLNYMDVFSRMQIENLIMKYQPTMLLVEHDEMFASRCATKKAVF